MSNKRSKDDIDIESLVESVPLDKGLVEGLQQLDRDELAAVLAHVANVANISTAAFKKTRTELPSFSVAKWSNFARQFGLPQNVSKLELEPFTTPRFRLPPSLHEAMFENAWRWQDVYREKVDHTREEARVRILDPYIVPIVALFQGRIIDKPEQSMMETQYSTGGEVEHEIFVIGDALFFIIELKLDRPDANALAQMFLEFLSAAEMNKSIDFKGLRIYGLLTDLIQFKFYSYDPTTNQFCFDETIIINNKRTDAFSDMMDVSNKIFGVVLSAYIESLRANITMSQDRAKGSKQNLSELRKNTGGRKSTDQWESALALAKQCCAKFKEPPASPLDIEEKANEALSLLTKSVRSIPRASTFTGGVDDPSTPAELKALATRIVKGTHECYFS